MNGSSLRSTPDTNMIIFMSGKGYITEKALAGTERTDSKERHSTEGKNAIKQHCML